MIRVRVESKGDFNNLKGFLSKIKEKQLLKNLDKYGELGVKALSAATPVRTGNLADSWYYTIEEKGNSSFIITWCNDVTNSNDKYSVNIALILDKGHGTGWGGYVQGRHFISPAIQPVFDKIADDAWKEVVMF